MLQEYLRATLGCLARIGHAHDTDEAGEFALKLADDQTDTDKQHGYGEAANDPFATDPSRQTGADLGAANHSNSDHCDARQALCKQAMGGVYERARQGHDGENKV